MNETEAIINSQPLTVETINDRQSANLISPNKIFAMKMKVVMPPPGVFQKPDLYWRSRWRRIQHFSNEFCCRWREELSRPCRNVRSESKMSRDFCTGDTVLLKTDLMTQNHWPMCNVIGTNSDDKGVVWNIKLLLSNSGIKDDHCILEQTITKIVLLRSWRHQLPNDRSLMNKVLNHLHRASCSCHHDSFHIKYVEDSSYHDLNSWCESDAIGIA